MRYTVKSCMNIESQNKLLTRLKQASVCIIRMNNRKINIENNKYDSNKKDREQMLQLI